MFNWEEKNHCFFCGNVTFTNHKWQISGEKSKYRNKHNKNSNKLYLSIHRFVWTPQLVTAEFSYIFFIYTQQLSCSIKMYSACFDDVKWLYRWNAKCVAANKFTHVNEIFAPQICLFNLLIDDTFMWQFLIFTTLRDNFYYFHLSSCHTSTSRFTLFAVFCC